MSIYLKLNQARKKFHSLPLKKSGHNKFAGYYYFELGDFLIPAMQVLDECDLCAIVSFTADIASLRLVNMVDNSEITITSPMGSAALKGCHEVQNIGAVETYQRRYLWVALLEIVEHDAVDAVTGKDDLEVKTSKKTISKVETLAKFIEQSFIAGNEWAAFEAWEQRGMSAEDSTAVWGLLGSKCRSTIKNMAAEAVKPVTA